MSQSARVTIYTTPTCAFCHMAKEYFKGNDVEYSAKDVTQDQEAYKEILDKSGQLGVPVIDIDGTIIIGFDRPKIDAVMREKGMK